MPKELTTAEYQALAELRYRIRKFLREGDTVASESGLEPQQYLLLLMIRGIPDGQEATVSNLAQITLAGDTVFGDDVGATQLGTVTGDAGTGYTVRLPVRVDPRTTP